MKLNLFAIFIGGIILLQSCETKKSYISKFDEFVSETSSNYKNFSEKDWVRVDSTFALLENDGLNKWRNELTPDESKHVNELKGKYYALKVKAGFEGVKNGLNDLIDQTDSFLKELTSDSTLNK